MFERGPDHTQGYERPWLIQRLRIPYEAPKSEKDKALHSLMNSFAFGGGLPNGGLTQDAMKLLNPIFSFDYMGAAEFEFGVVPVTLGYIMEHLDAYELHVKDFTTKKGNTARIYFILPTEFLDEIIEFISEEAKAPQWEALKEPTHLKMTIDNEKFIDRRVAGWLELDNGYFFFTDEKMFVDVAKLFTFELPDDLDDLLM